MTVIDTSTASTATAYSNQRKTDRCQNGVLWTTFWNGNTSALNDSFEFWYSTDDGATWTLDSGFPFSGSNANHTPDASFFIDIDDYAHVVYNDLNDGDTYYRRGTPNAARTAWTWSAATTVESNSNGSVSDVIAHREGTGWVAHVVYSFTSSTSTFARYVRIDISSSGTLTVSPTSNISGDYANANKTWPSIDFNHTGDGKTIAGSTPHLYAAWSAGATGAGKGIRFKKATYSAGSWTWGTEREIDSTRYVSNANYWLNCLFDGSRVIIGGQVYDGTNVDVVLHERDAADTTTTSRVLFDNANSTGNMLTGGSATYDGDGNVYLFGKQTALHYRRWARATATVDAAVEIDATVGTNPYVSAKRGYSDSLIEFIYTDGSASPYSVTYGSITLNTAPNAPTGLSPDGTTIDRTSTNRFSWTFSDPDSGDSQSQYDLRYRTVGSSTWTDVSGTTTNQFHDFSGGTFAAGDYEWQVRTYDAAGEVGPYSSSAFFTAASPPSTPSITDPIAGQTISTENYTVKWSAPSQSAYQVRTVADSAGSPDTSTVYQDTGEVTSTSARSRTMSFDTNGRDEHVQVRIKSSGLWSTWASVNVTVSYTAPATPTVTVTADTPTGAITVEATHPTPTGSEPTVTSMDVYRRVTADGGDGIRIAAGAAPSATTVDYAVASGTDYGYRVRAIGDNDVSTYSAWTV